MQFLIGALAAVAAMVCLAGFYLKGVRRELLQIAARLKGVEHFSPTPPSSLQAGKRTAVLLVSNYDVPGMHLFLAVLDLFPGLFAQYVVLLVGPDSNNAEVLEEYAGFAAARRIRCVGARAGGPDPVSQGLAQCREIQDACPDAVFFCETIVFQRDEWYHRALKNRPSHKLVRQLENTNLPVFKLPILLAYAEEKGSQSIVAERITCRQ